MVFPCTRAPHRYAALGAACTVFYARTLPDTVGRSLEDLEQQRELLGGAASSSAMATGSDSADKEGVELVARHEPG